MITALEPADINYAIFRQCNHGESITQIAIDLDVSTSTLRSGLKQYARKGLAAFSLMVIKDELEELTAGLDTNQAYEKLSRMGFQWASPSSMRQAFNRAGILLKYAERRDTFISLPRDSRGRVCKATSN